MPREERVLKRGRSTAWAWRGVAWGRGSGKWDYLSSRIGERGFVYKPEKIQLAFRPHFAVTFTVSERGGKSFRSDCYCTPADLQSIQPFVRVFSDSTCPNGRCGHRFSISRAHCSYMSSSSVNPDPGQMPVNRAPENVCARKRVV